MRTKGKITHWNEEKGYDFITPSTGAKQVFVNISAFRNRSEPPTIDQLVEFALSTDKQGRPCAVRVTRAGERLPGEIKRNDRYLYVVDAGLFLLLVAASVAVGRLPPEILLLYMGASLVTYFMYFWDKSAARTGAWRTQEITLHLLSLLGGWPGALIAQQTLRHKSRKASFRAVFWLTVLVNCGLFIWLFTPSGSELLRRILAA
ncbi:MAG: DUF1294 domain-containing protein [Xanthomonadales bacterium]|jgi:uncharacterized membrane protein YsdA (DUF1294 family)/cold shock CspA family protein|nr:DUF1294 domain-containing protein [Xanthomonadales bacterium]